MGSTTHAAKYTAMNDSVPALRKYWDFVFMELSDPRTKDWPLLGSPLPGLGILVGYLIFVKFIGPWYMQDKKPFILHKTLILYNAVQVAISAHLVYEALDAVWLTKYSYFRCEPVDWSVTPETMRIARGFYIYFLAKISELLDTVFFVLRKKDRQVTFLHLYHHTAMPMVAWGAAKYYPGGHGSFIGLINSFVHIIMYTYYMFAAMGPQFQKYLWWKKFVTVIQLIQFLLTFYHFLQLLWSDCDYPKWSVIIVVPNAIFFYYLFSDFYKKAYRKHNEKEEDQEEEEDDDQNENVVSNGKKHD